METGQRMPCVRDIMWHGGGVCDMRCSCSSDSHRFYTRDRDIGPQEMSDMQVVW